MSAKNDRSLFSKQNILSINLTFIYFCFLQITNAFILEKNIEYDSPIFLPISDSDFGPIFYQEPNQPNSFNPSIYTNDSSLIFSCKANGYPIPSIEWRVDNVSLSNYKTFVKSQQKQQISHILDTFFFPQLNTIVTLRDHDNTLVIGGSGDPTKLNNFQYYQTQQKQRQKRQIVSSGVHKLECLASNRFGTVISRPVIVEQQQETYELFGITPTENLVSLQLYDEFVTRGNIAVLKCLLMNVHSSNAASKSIEKQSRSTTYQQQQQQLKENKLFAQKFEPDFNFEWKIKSSPNSGNGASSNYEPIIRIKAGQWQGKYTAFYTGELHVRDVDENDSKKTFQCLASPKQQKQHPQQQKSSSHDSFYESSDINEFDFYTSSQPFPVESPVAQIILSGSEKEIFPPRIIHRLTTTSTGSTSTSSISEIMVENGQTDSIIIPCASQGMPLSTTHWFWIPIHLSNDTVTTTSSSSSVYTQYEIETELNLHQSSSSSSSTSFLWPHPLAIALPITTESLESLTKPLNIDKNSKLSNHHHHSHISATRQQQLSLSRLRVHGSGSALTIPGPISPLDSGYYVAIVNNNLGQERCITRLLVHSLLSIQLRWSSMLAQKMEQKFRNKIYDSSLTFQDTLQAGGVNSTNRIIHASRGDTISLKCSVSGFPVKRIYFLHNGRLILENEGNLLKSSSVHLSSETISSQANGNRASASLNSASIEVEMMLDILLDDQNKAGMYQCFAENSYESVQTIVQILVIDRAPSIVENFKVLTVESGDFVYLRCTATGSPLAQIQWFRDGDSLPSVNRFRSGDFVLNSQQVVEAESLLVSHLNISSVRVEDSGLYRCLAHNTAGTVFHEARLNIHGKIQKRKILKNVTALAGLDLELNCPFVGWPVTSIVWFGKEGANRKLPFNGRQHISSNGTLHLSKVNPKEDEGSYECEVHQDGSSPIKSKFFLTIQTPPLINNFTFPTNLEEGMRIMTICDVIAGDSPMRISWLKDGVLIDNLDPKETGFRITLLNDFTSSITFMALKREHAGRYSCIAKNIASMAQHSADLQVNVAPVWLIEPKDISTIAGQRLSIHCQAEGIPEPQIRWKMENFSPSSSDNDYQHLAMSSLYGVRPEKHSDFSQLSSTGTLDSESRNDDSSSTFHAVISNPHMQILENGTLLIKEVGKDDHRRYMCSAFNSVAGGISTIIRLSVNFPPQFVNGYYEARQSKMGDTIVLHCLVRVEHIEPVNQNRTDDILSDIKNSNARTLAMEMRWYKIDGKPSKIASHGHTSGGGNTKNKIGGGRAHSSTLDRYHITSMFDITDPNSLLLSNLSTISTGNSAPISEHILYYVTTLTIRQVERADTGTYLCSAQNSYGIIRKNFSIQILEQPEIPSDVRTDSVTSTSFKLAWSTPFDGNSPITEYVITYRASTSSIPTTITVYSSATSDLRYNRKWMSYQINDLTPFTSYSVQIKAKNSIGFSQFSDSITVKTSEEPPSEIASEVTILPLNTHSLKISWKKPRPLKMINNKYTPPVTGYYIGYKINQLNSKSSSLSSYGNEEIMHSVQEGNTNEFVFKTVKSSDSDSEVFILSNLKRSTRYDIKIQAFNLAGAGPSTGEFLGKTLDFDVPSAPRIRALKSNLSSIELMLSVQGNEPINGFIVSYKAATNIDFNVPSSNSEPMIMDVENKQWSGVDKTDWKTIKIELTDSEDDDSSSAAEVVQKTASITTVQGLQLSSKKIIYEGSSIFHRRTFSLNGLRCGTKYFFYVNAYNPIGQGDPSEVILSRTEGNVPIAPEDISNFLNVNTTFIIVNLFHWKRLGCPISMFEFEYFIYGIEHRLSAHKLIYRLPTTLSSTVEHQQKNRQTNITNIIPTLSTSLLKSGALQISTAEDSLPLSSNDNSQDFFTISNLSPGTWYELEIKALTEAGITRRDYYFATLQNDGSTVPPMTFRSTDFIESGFNLGSHSEDTSRSSFVSLKSSLSQLHYIVPVSCTFFIIFLVIIVVCIIHTAHQQRPQMNAFAVSSPAGISDGQTQQNTCHGHSPETSSNFFLSFINSRQRSNQKISGSTSKSFCSNSSTSGHYTSTSGASSNLMMLITHEPNNSGGNYCDKVIDGLAMRNESCHSLMSCTAAAANSGGKNLSKSCDPNSFHLETIKLLDKNIESIPPPPPLPPSLGQNTETASQYPLYNLPVPYATSGLIQQQRISENLYGFSASVSQVSGLSGSIPNAWNKGHLDEMYCDRPMTILQEGVFNIPTSSSSSSSMIQQQQQQQQQKALLNTARKQSHNYELPFAISKPSDSTAF